MSHQWFESSKASAEDWYAVARRCTGGDVRSDSCEGPAVCGVSAYFRGMRSSLRHSECSEAHEGERNILKRSQIMPEK